MHSVLSIVSLFPSCPFSFCHCICLSFRGSTASNCLVGIFKCFWYSGYDLWHLTTSLTRWTSSYDLWHLTTSLTRWISSYDLWHLTTSLTPWISSYDLWHLTTSLTRWTSNYDLWHLTTSLTWWTSSYDLWHLTTSLTRWTSSYDIWHQTTSLPRWTLVLATKPTSRASWHLAMDRDLYQSGISTPPLSISMVVTIELTNCYHWPLTHTTELWSNMTVIYRVKTTHLRLTIILIIPYIFFYII
jgi:hypothetical protein